ncbi:hypothetical protein CRENBAI_017068 [Crenichthys baileyi]|uniref:TNFR-Cys domain-containing protein n=1 Tax=Crenichthys baileyi TaxID=28760 RepID=A0AAV9R656_9TELE
MWSMLIILVGFALIEPGSNCGPKEYRTSDGQCCPMCHEGTVVGRDCTVQSGTRCLPCDTGTYMNQPNGLTRCLPCSFCDPGVGLFAQQNCTPTSDTVCDVLSGYFCKSLADRIGCSTAEIHSVCDPGQRIKQPGTSRHDTVCEVCQEGSFSPHGVNCTLWTKQQHLATALRTDGRYDGYMEKMQTEEKEKKKRRDTKSGIWIIPTNWGLLWFNHLLFLLTMT